MTEQEVKEFKNIQKKIPKSQQGIEWCYNKDGSKTIITRDKSGEYILNNLSQNKIEKIKQSQDGKKLEEILNKNMKRTDK